MQKILTSSLTMAGKNEMLDQLKLTVFHDLCTNKESLTIPLSSKLPVPYIIQNHNKKETKVEL